MKDHLYKRKRLCSPLKNDLDLDDLIKQTALGSNWVTHQVRDQNASIIKCKMAGKVEGRSTSLTPEQNKKIATVLKHAERYIV